MAIMTEEERALQYGRYAPRSDFNVRPMSAVDTTSKYEKIKPDTKEADAFISSMRTAISNYSSAYEQAKLKAASEQENQLFGAYERSVNDLRIQYEAGKLNPTQYSRLMAQLDNNILKQGVDVSKFNTVRSAIGGNMSQQATAAALKEQAKNEVEFRDKRIQELQSAFPAYKNKSYDELGAIYDRNVAIYKRAEDLNNILNDPSVTQEQRISMLGDSIRTGTDLGIVKSLEYVENWIVANPDVPLDKINFNDVEAGVHNMLKSAGYKDEALISTMVEAATANLRQAANLNIGYINDATAHSKEMLDYIQTNRDLNLQSNYPLLAYVQGSKDPGTTLAQMNTEQITAFKKEQERYIKEYGPYTEQLKESLNKAQVIEYDNGDTPLKFYNSIAQNGKVRVIAPDFWLTAKANANSAARKSYANSDNGGLFNVSSQDLATAKDAIDKIDQLNKTSGAVVAAKGQNQAIANMCNAEEGCVEAAKNVLAELTNPTTPLSQAAEFMRGSIQADRLRLTPDGQVVLTKDKGWGQSIAEVFETTNYMKALSAVNRYLANQRTPQAKAYAATAMFGEGLKMLGSEEAEDFEDKWIKGTTSAAINIAGEGIGGATRAVSEWNKEREHTPRERFLQRFNNPETTSEWNKEREHTPRERFLQRFNNPETTTTKLSSSSSQTYGNAYPSVEVEPDSEEGQRLLKELKDIDRDIKGSEGSHDSLNHIIERFNRNGWDASEFEETRDNLLDRRNEIMKKLYYDPADDEEFETIDNTLNRYANEYGVDFRQVSAILDRESKGNARAVSPAGAKGLMQLMPDTFEEVKKELGLPKDADIFDPETNIKAGVYYFSKMMKQFDGDVNKALAAYNWGPGNVSTAVKQYGDNWFEGARTKGIKVRVKGKDVIRKLPKETLNYVSALGQTYA